MLCNQVLNGMVGAFRVMSFRPGKEFEVITVSFDSRETPALAAAKKSTYVAYLPEEKRADAASGWYHCEHVFRSWILSREPSRQRRTGGPAA